MASDLFVAAVPDRHESQKSGSSNEAWMVSILCLGVLLLSIAVCVAALREPEKAEALEPPRSAIVALPAPVEQAVERAITPPATPARQRQTKDLLEPPPAEVPALALAASSERLADESVAYPLAQETFTQFNAEEARMLSKPKAASVPKWTEAQLLAQLRRVPQVGLTKAGETAAIAAARRELDRHGRAAHPHGFLAGILERQPELATLPWRKGAEAILERDQAEALDVLSVQLRNLIRSFSQRRKSVLPPENRLVIRAPLLLGALTTGLITDERARRDYGSDSISLKNLFRSWQQPASVPTLNQILMAEDAPARAVLIDLLAKIEGPAATEALAQRAMFDLSPELRQLAVSALRARPVEEARAALLRGFQHPWLPVNYHAAEALIALQDHDAIPELEAMLGQPDPRHPVRIEGTSQFAVREVVKINHTANCVLCHAPSLRPTDLVRRATVEKRVDRRMVINVRGTQVLPSGMSVSYGYAVTGWASGDVVGISGALADNDLAEFSPASREMANFAVSLVQGDSPAAATLPTPPSRSNYYSSDAPSIASASGPSSAGPGGAGGPGLGAPGGIPPTRPKVPVPEQLRVLVGAPEVRFRETQQFIRGDLTMLRQDFSLLQSNLWGALPQTERFDYLVRLRPLTSEEYAERLTKNATGQTHIRPHEAVLYALDRLGAVGGGGKQPVAVFTGKQVGTDPGPAVRVAGAAEAAKRTP